MVVLDLFYDTFTEFFERTYSKRAWALVRSKSALDAESSLSRDDINDR